MGSSQLKILCANKEIDPERIVPKRLGSPISPTNIEYDTVVPAKHLPSAEELYECYQQLRAVLSKLPSSNPSFVFRKR